MTEDKAVGSEDRLRDQAQLWCGTAGRAVMMAVDEKKRMLLVRQYRLPAEKYLWELPAGRLDDGEKPLQAAKRELIEETGYRGAEVEQAGVVLCEPRLRAGADDDLSWPTDLTAGEGHSDGRRAHRGALVREEGAWRR